MKLSTVTILGAILVAGIAQAKQPEFAKCPVGTFTTQQCISTPKKGESKIAAEMFNAISVCVSGQKVILSLLEKTGAVTNEADVLPRSGSVEYSISDSGQKVMSLTLGTGMKPSPVRGARFSMYMEQNNKVKALSSTYTCYRVR